MRISKTLLLLIAAYSVILLITDYNISFASSAQSRSQSTIAECTGDSCYTVSCSNDRPCQTFSSNRPSFVQPSQEGTSAAAMQPAEETPIMQSLEESTTAMQPVIEVPVEFCNDGLDNDDDGSVDEECGAATFSSALPNDLMDREEKQHDEEYEHSDDEYEHSDDEYEHSDETNEVTDEKDHEY
jgi:hypothetical protein